MIKMKDLFESFDKVSGLLSDPQNNEKTIFQLLDDFKERGGEILGAGRYATVLFHPSWKHVVKIFSDDVPYLKFVRFAMKNHRNSFPIFYDKPRRIIPNYKRHKSNTYLYVVKTEKLLPINMKEYDNIQYYLYYDKHNAKRMVDAQNDPEDLAYDPRRINRTWEFIYNKLNELEKSIPSLPNYKEDYNFLMNNSVDFGAPDLHSKNIMKRNNGSFVLVDPFWEGETPYQTHDRLLKAEMGYDDYDSHKNSNKDMIRGGEKFKVPKPLKPLKPTINKPSSNDDEVSF